MSDHNPLAWIIILKDPGSRLLRWRIQLEEYDYEVVYKPGVQNSNADTLSRIGALAKEGGEFDETVPGMKVKILQENHDSILSGHRGMNKTYKAIKRYYQWLNMKKRSRRICKEMCKMSIN